MFLLILGIYATVGVTLVLILRMMSRRFRASDAAIEAGGPYGPAEEVVVPSDDTVGVR